MIIVEFREWWPENSVVDTVPYRPVRPKYTVPAGNPVQVTYLFRTGGNTGRTGLVPAVPANTGCTGRYLNTGPKWKKTGYVNFDISKGKIVISLNPNSKTLTLPSCSRTSLFLSFFLSVVALYPVLYFSHSLGQTQSQLSLILAAHRSHSQLSLILIWVTPLSHTVR